MSKSSPSPPQAPDPGEVAQAEALANRVNIVSPAGTLTFGDANDTATIGESPAQRHLRETRELTSSFLGNLGLQNLGPLGISPQSFNASALPLATNLPDTSAQAAFDRVSNRLRPEFDRRTEALDQRLANQGLPIGSEAFAEAKRVENDAQTRQLEDAALAAEAQEFGNALAGGNLQFGQGLQRRQQGVAEQESLRARQFSELASLLGGQQVGVQGVQQPNIAPVDVAGAFQNQFLGQQNAFNQQQAGRRNTLGLLGGLGGSILGGPIGGRIGGALFGG